MNEEYLEVNFEKYCQTCQHKELEEKFDPCNRCLEHGCNLNSHKPVMWEEKNEINRQCYCKLGFLLVERCRHFNCGSQKNGRVDVINAYQGKEAYELYRKLIIQRKGANK